MKRNAYDESVMEHSWEVSVIAHLLALIKNRYFDGNLDANAIAATALYHDVTEVITGDLPTPIKYYSRQITRAYKKIEKQAEAELLALLPNELKIDLEIFVCGDCISLENEAIIKAADRISAYLKCQAELKAGNSEFTMAAEHIGKELACLTQPEVVFLWKILFLVVI